MIPRILVSKTQLPERPGMRHKYAAISRAAIIAALIPAAVMPPVCCLSPMMLSSQPSPSVFLCFSFFLFIIEPLSNLVPVKNPRIDRMRVNFFVKLRNYIHM